jgi:hypothetical protein
LHCSPVRKLSVTDTRIVERVVPPHGTRALLRKELSGNPACPLLHLWYYELGRCPNMRGLSVTHTPHCKPPWTLAR